MRKAEFPYLPKDFIETAEGLIFAVVSYQAQDGKVMLEMEVNAEKLLLKKLTFY